MIKKNIILVLATLTVLAGCQNPSTTEQTASQIARQNRTKVADVVPAEEIVPTFKISQSGQTGEFKLRSQTAKYLNDNQSSVEIILSNTIAASCQTRSPKLQDQNQQIKITVKAKDGKTPISKTELIGSSAFEISVSKLNKDGETKLDSQLIQSIKISDLNAAIIRGTLKVAASSDGKTESMEGEFFTAVCK